MWFAWALAFGANDVIVDAAWVRTHPEAIRVEAYWGGGRAQTAPPLPDAVGVDTDSFENGRPRWHLRPLAEVRTVIGRLGIDERSTVVVYSTQTIAAARVWWILHYAGVRDVRFLNGGADAWARAGFPLARELRRPKPVRYAAAARVGALATMEDVRARLGRVTLGDVRSRAEFDGGTSGYDYLERAGRIPGAIHLEDADDRAQVYQTAGGRLRAPVEIEQLWRARGVTGGKPVIFYCGSGWRSSLAYLYAWALGWRDVRNFSDGWSGWSTLYSLEGSTWIQRPSANPVEP